MGKRVRERSLIGYRGVIPDLLRYQLCTKAILLVLAWGLRSLRTALLWTSGRTAVTSGDLWFVLGSWQGWLLVLLGIAFLLLYMVFDINAMIILSSDVLHGRRIRVWRILGEAFASLGRFRSWTGLGIVLFAAFLVPLAGFGLGLSLTETFYIPDFITSVIYSNSLYNVLYNAVLLVVFLVAFLYLFVFHRIVLGGEDARTAVREARLLMQTNWWDFLRRYLRFFFRCAFVGVAIAAVTIALAVGVAYVFDTDDMERFRALISFITYGVLTVASIYALLFPPFQFLMLTRIYESYTTEDEGEARFPERRHHPWMAVAVVVWLLILVVASFGTATIFDEVFPEVGNTDVIAHRAGGTLGNENTVVGLERAIEAGAEAAEVDIQRTSDGHYILNHDDDFRRLAGVSATSSELTLAEVKELSVSGYSLSGASTEFATLEEILDAADGRVHLYIELKGETADEQMADDAYAIVSERGMLDQVTFISLDYAEIQYLEESHPDATTGYLCYAAFGDLQDINVDELILEEETATPDNIDRIHAAGKRVSVWTVNTGIGMLRFFSRGVDGVITDEVSDALWVRDMLNATDGMEYGEVLEDLERVVLCAVFVWWAS